MARLFGTSFVARNEFFMDIHTSTLFNSIAEFTLQPHLKGYLVRLGLLLIVVAGASPLLADLAGRTPQQQLATGELSGVGVRPPPSAKL